jgi:ribosome-associated protein
MPRAPSQVALSAKHAPRDAADPARAERRTNARGQLEAQRSARTAAEAALDKKAEDVKVIDLRDQATYTDFLVVCSGSSDRQLEAVADAVEKAMAEKGQRLIGSEGLRGGHWALLDFGDVVVHVFHRDERNHYDLEGLWADAPVETVEAR